MVKLQQWTTDLIVLNNKVMCTTTIHMLSSTKWILGCSFPNAYFTPAPTSPVQLSDIYEKGEGTGDEHTANFWKWLVFFP